MLSHNELHNPDICSPTPKWDLHQFHQADLCLLPAYHWQDWLHGAFSAKGMTHKSDLRQYQTYQYKNN